MGNYGKSKEELKEHFVNVLESIGITNIKDVKYIQKPKKEDNKVWIIK